MSMESRAALNDQRRRPSQRNRLQNAKQDQALPDALCVQWGNLRGTRYDFKREGDLLPRHTHLDNAHVVIVQLGSCVVREFEGGKIIEYRVAAGQTLDSAVPVEHEIEALEDNTRILNLIK